MPDKLARLTAIGFTQVGAWQLSGCGLAFNVTEDSTGCRSVLYAFTEDGALAYIGKTTGLLRDRLQRYKTPAKSSERGGSTNIKNNRNIFRALSLGMAVEVYVLQHAMTQEHGGFAVNFAAGLEDSLIAALSPPWNGRQVLAADAVVLSEVTPSSPASAVLLIVAPRAERASEPTTRVTATDFRRALERVLAESEGGDADYADVHAGQLHRRVGGYPGPSHAMPVCCSVMRAAMRPGDLVTAQPPKGKGASLTIRYRLPR